MGSECMRKQQQVANIPCWVGDDSTVDCSLSDDSFLGLSMRNG